jgi:ketosteroid isomerase-like protein
LHRRVAVVLLTAALAVGAAPARALDPTDTVFAVITKVVAAINADDLATLKRLVPGDARIVDDFPPYAFVGIAAWGGGFAEYAKTKGITEPAIAVRKGDFVTVSGNVAYAPVPTTYTYKLQGEAKSQRGVLVFRLRHRPGGWIVTTFTWARTE